MLSKNMEETKTLKVLTVKDVCGILKIGRDATYSLMKSSSFPSYRLNNKLYVTEENLNKWINSITHKQFIIDNK